MEEVNTQVLAPLNDLTKCILLIEEEDCPIKEGQEDPIEGQSVTDTSDFRFEGGQISLFVTGWIDHGANEWLGFSLNP